ncbi:MAG: HNH endonuclease [Hyphomonas sp.]
MIQKICCALGCDELAVPGRPHCPEHAAEADAKLAARRAAAKTSEAALARSKLYATERWRKAARGFLDRHPLCADCAELGRVRAATEVDHIVPHGGDAQLMWARANWQPLCKPCHSRKTAREVFASARRTPRS